MVKSFEDLYYESQAYTEIIEELGALRDKLDQEINSSSSLVEIVNDFWKWAEKAEKLEKEAFERGETNLNGDEEYESGRNIKWILKDLSEIKLLDGHLKEKELVAGIELYYKENYKE